MIDLATATPAEIDTILADIYYAEFVAESRARDLRARADEAENYYHYDYRTRTRTLKPRLKEAARLRALAEEQDAIAAEKAEEMAPYEAEFARRGGWTRAFLVVTNGTGHVHRSRACHTCYITTQFHWVTAFSGHDEDEIVEAAGERACTICYPSAPAHVLNRPTKMFTKDEEAKAAARAEREAKRTAKDALAVLDPATGKVLFKTERGATNDIASNLGDYLRYDDAEYLAQAQRTIAAVAAKRGADAAALEAELLDKATKKFRREAVKSIKQMLLTAGRPGYRDMSDPADWLPAYQRIAKEEGLI